VSVPSGLVIVDKPAGWTSHDVVGKVRRIAGTRRVGHAGTLDPMATGVLVVGVEKATRLLGYLALTDKDYDATIRLGEATDSGDADGEVISRTPASGVSRAALAAAVAGLTGEILQVPPAVSAIKVKGRRAYQLTREGAPPALPPRPVTVTAFGVRDVRPAGGTLDVDVSVTCSTGTYVRALARDLGEALGVGGHLTALRRTRSGPYHVTEAWPLAELADLANRDTGGAGPGERGELTTRGFLTPLAEAAAAAFPAWRLTAGQARALSLGIRQPAAGLGPGPTAAFAPDGSLIALVTDGGPLVRTLAVFTPGWAERDAGDPGDDPGMAGLGQRRAAPDHAPDPRG